LACSQKECVEAAKEPKSLPLTWDQVEEHRGATVKGTLEVKVMLDESLTRQVFSCKDRVGVVRRVAAYTDCRAIPGLNLWMEVVERGLKKRICPTLQYFNSA